MNPSEYDAMSRIEATHWWFEGTRRCFAALLKRTGLLEEFRGRPALDAGCGTGGNLKWLADAFHSEPLWGFDASDIAVQYSTVRNGQAKVWIQDLCRAEELDASVQPHFILCSDVLYCIDREAGVQGLRALCDRLPSRGCLLLHVPACQWLYSEHDVAVGTRQRYSKNEVIGILSSLGLNAEVISYRMFLLFPLVVMRRLKSLVCGVGRKSEPAHSELTQPSIWINWLLGSAVAMENFGLSVGLTYPIGSSLIAIGRKP